MAVVAVAGALVTVSAAWTARRLDRSNERSLLTVQTKQAADVIGSAITGIVGPLQTALAVEAATGGDQQHFRQYMARYAAPGKVFVSSSLWRNDGDTATPVASVGAASFLAPTSPAARAFIRRAVRSDTFVVTSIASGNSQRIGYALADPADRTYIVYAERVIPPTRQVAVENDPAFADLKFATYLGPSERLSALATTNVALSRLPLSGHRARDSIPFGDTTLTLVAAPAGHLGGELAARLPWIFLGGGLALSAIGALIAGLLVRRRRAAELDARTITALYDELDGLYAQQRSVSLTLQHALLPKTNPPVPGVEFASRYVAGDNGVEIGGDWYSVVPVDDAHFAFVVGDVSGRGVDAAAIMARIRFSLRAYLLEGHPPGHALGMVSKDLDVSRDRHIATALVGVADIATRTVTLANAGHLDALLISENGSRFVSTDGGPPLGVGQTEYRTTTIRIPAGAVLLAFTDGLVERRTEIIDDGLARLAAAARPGDRSLDELLTTVLSTMVGNASEDDIAMLALRWSAAKPQPLPADGLARASAG